MEKINDIVDKLRNCNKTSNKTPIELSKEECRVLLKELNVLGWYRLMASDKEAEINQLKQATELYKTTLDKLIFSLGTNNGNGNLQHKI